MKSLKRMFRTNRKLFTGVALLLAVVTIFWVIQNPAIVGVAATKRLLPIYSVQRDDKVVALSFDAAWGNII